MAKKTYPRVVDLLNQHIPAMVSRNEFCRSTGINRNSIDRYLAGLGCPTDETLVKLSDYFDVSIPWLRGEDTRTFEEAKGEIDKTVLKGLIKIVDEYYIEKNILIDIGSKAELIADMYDKFKKEKTDQLSLREKAEEFLNNVK